MRGNFRGVSLCRCLLIIGLVSVGAAMFSVTPASAANLCPPGYYSSTGTDEAGCIAAPVGTFVGDFGATSATPCSAGYYEPNTASTSCIAAPAGTFVSGPGAIQPTQCVPGSYQPNTASTTCMEAPAGTFVSGPGATQPTPCVPGYYQPYTASTSCFAAVPGKFVSGYGATAASLCSAGSYQPNAAKTSCLPADIGYYVPTTGQATETPCSPLYTTMAPGATACVTTISVMATQVVGVGPGASLSDKVAQVRAGLDANDYADACTSLKSFINEVNAQTGKTITPVQAATFVGEAQSMRAALGC